jgi:hypothetical protein
MNLFVGADVSYGGGNLDTKFNWDSTTKKNKIIASYKQIYYSIDIDTPTCPADFFAASMEVDDIKEALPNGAKPLYVCSVSYGMMAYVLSKQIIVLKILDGHWMQPTALGPWT